MTIRRSLLAVAALPLALGLAACGAKEGEGAPPKGEAIAKIAPPAGKTWQDVIEETADGGMRMGNPEAPIKLIEYGSLTCPHCAKLSQEGFAPLVSNYVASGRVSFEFRSFAIHPQDVPLTVLARCSSKEAFFPLIEQVYTNFDAINAPFQDEAVLQRAQATMQLPPEQRWSAFADAVGYTQFFAARGVAVDQAKACLADLPKAKQVADHAQKYSADGITGTPALVLNGVKLDTNTWSGLEVALQNAGAR
ncbi:MAG TPA: thioredoxin domain-containing protein [Novosphingobium sp.]|nr:thioredoxin domain-containing protein [Novosphingobium sp.]